MAFCTYSAHFHAALRVQPICRGQDIDYIKIKADADHGAARSYNYRVIMVAGGAELDMRGRCSAGQKVIRCYFIEFPLHSTIIPETCVCLGALLLQPSAAG